MPGWPPTTTDPRAGDAFDRSPRTVVGRPTPAPLGRAGRIGPVGANHRQGPNEADTPSSLPLSIPTSLDEQVTARWGLSGEQAEATLRLPTAAGVPLPSPDLHVGVAAAAPQHVVLRPWVLPTVAFEASEAVDLLLGRVLADRSVGDVAARGEAGTEAVISASVRALEDMAVLALDMVVRGRFLPGVEHDLAADVVPRWLPVPGGADLERLGALVRSLPPVCEPACPVIRTRPLQRSWLVSSPTWSMDSHGAVPRASRSRPERPGRPLATAVQVMPRPMAG